MVCTIYDPIAIRGSAFPATETNTVPTKLTKRNTGGTRKNSVRRLAQERPYADGDIERQYTRTDDNPRGVFQRRYHAEPEVQDRHKQEQGGKKGGYVLEYPTGKPGLKLVFQWVHTGNY